MLQRSRILIAEDDALSASLLRQLLEDEHVCRLTRDGHEALQAARTENFDLMLVDVMMPGLDGLELCRELRKLERTANIPIILVTARARTDEIVAGFEAGANDYVPKPVDPAVLLARVSTHLRMARLRRQSQDLTSMLTHDLKNSLMLILSASSVLQHETDAKRASPKDTEKYFNIVASNVQRMQSMINNHLTLSQLEGERFPLRPQTFDPQEMIDVLFEDALALAAPKNIALSCETRDLPDQIHADREKLARAVQNLLGNAIRITPENGRILFSPRAQDDKIVFVVDDSGPGLPQDLLPKIFDLYERGGSEGTGLGLAIVKLVAEAHHGDVSAENRPEGGARFSIWVPLAPRENHSKDRIAGAPQ
jgi:two-component system sensor histidine kinase/response regulator